MGQLVGTWRVQLSGFQVFIDESFTSLLFGRVKRIDLGNLGNEGVPEFDGMIERSMRRKNVVSLLREDISEVGAEVGDRDLLGFVSLSQLGRDCDLTDLFCRSSCLKVILMERPVIFGRRYRGEQLKEFMISIEAKVASMIRDMVMRRQRWTHREAVPINPGIPFL